MDYDINDFVNENEQYLYFDVIFYMYIELIYYIIFKRYINSSNLYNMIRFVQLKKKALKCAFNNKKELKSKLTHSTPITTYTLQLTNIFDFSELESLNFMVKKYIVKKHIIKKKIFSNSKKKKILKKTNLKHNILNSKKNKSLKKTNLKHSILNSKKNKNLKKIKLKHKIFNSKKKNLLKKAKLKLKLFFKKKKSFNKAFFKIRKSRRLKLLKKFKKLRINNKSIIIKKKLRHFPSFERLIISSRYYKQLRITKPYKLIRGKRKYLSSFFSDKYRMNSNRKMLVRNCSKMLFYVISLIKPIYRIDILL